MPLLNGPRRSIATMFGTEKLKWCGYRTWKSLTVWWHVQNSRSDADINNRLDRIPACDGQTDGRADILRQHGLRYA